MVIRGAVLSDIPSDAGQDSGWLLWLILDSLKSFCFWMSELSIKCSARCTLLPDVSSSELLSNLSQNTELLSNRGSEQNVAGSMAKSRFLRKLLHALCALFFRGEYFSPLVLVSKWGDAVRAPFCPHSVCADRDALGDSPASRWACLCPLQRSTDVSAVDGKAPRGHYNISIHGLLPCLYHQHDFCWCWCF